ncbi:hypothetical protein KCU77_g17598, partial [Aureobasidium melanogenum]
KLSLSITASNGLCGNSYTTKYNIDLLDNSVPAQPTGNDCTTKGPELWINGSIPSGVP